MRALPDREPDLEVTVYGEAKTKGSTKSFVPRNKKTGAIVRRPNGSPMVVTKNDAGEAAEAWAGAVADAVGKRMAETGFETIGPKVPVAIDLVFIRPRKQGDYGTGRNAGLLKDSAPGDPSVKPDVDKLARCVLDALKGVAWHDDGQVVGMPAWKEFGTPARLELRVWRLPATVGDIPASEPVGEPEDALFAQDSM